MVYINIKIALVALVAILFFSGCEEKVYTQFCSKGKLHVKMPPEAVNCLKVESIDSEVDTFLKQNIVTIPLTSECPFTLVGMHYHVKACKNPVANSRGADFDGYVKLQVFHNGACYYRVQQDFKSSPWQEQMSHIIKRLQKDLK